MQIYDINIPANKPQPIGTQGRFLYYLTGSAGGADNTLLVKAGNTGSTFLLKPGQSIRLAEKDRDIDTWYLSNNANAATIIGTVLIGDGVFDDNRISGSVEVIDGGKNRTLTAGSFLGSAVVGGTAAQLIHIQLWNPLGTGKRLVLQCLTYSCNVASNINIHTNNAALLTAGGYAAPKLVGSAVNTVAAVNYVSQAAENIGTGTFKQGSYNANSEIVFKPNEPVVIRPGYGVHVVAMTAAAVLSANFDYFEEADS